MGPASLRPALYASRSFLFLFCLYTVTHGEHSRRHGHGMSLELQINQKQSQKYMLPPRLYAGAAKFAKIPEASWAVAWRTQSKPCAPPTVDSPRPPEPSAGKYKLTCSRPPPPCHHCCPRHCSMSLSQLTAVQPPARAPRRAARRQPSGMSPASRPRVGSAARSWAREPSRLLERLAWRSTCRPSTEMRSLVPTVSALSSKKSSPGGPECSLRRCHGPHALRVASCKLGSRSLESPPPKAFDNQQ